MSSSTPTPTHENLTIRDVVTKGFVPYSSLHEDIEETSSMCQFCKNTSSVNRVYRIDCYFDKGETKRELAMCISCIHDYHHMYVEDVQRKQNVEPRLVVADKYDRTKSEIYSACRDIAKKNKDNATTTLLDADFIDTIKSLYETASAVKYYIGDSKNISLDNKKLWPIRHDIFVKDA
jgi:hypothetical protein